MSKNTKSNSEKILHSINKTIHKTTEDLEQQKYNTAIATLMRCTNELYKYKISGFDDKQTWQFALESLAMLSAPFAPHIAEELWHLLGHNDTIHKDHWPKADSNFLQENTVTIAVQINGKLRATIEVPIDSNEAEVTKISKQQENVAKYLDKEPKKTIYVANKLINFVV